MCIFVESILWIENDTFLTFLSHFEDSLLLCRLKSVLHKKSLNLEVQAFIYYFYSAEWVFLFSRILPKSKPISKSSHIGIASITIEIASGGVINIATKKHPTIIKRRFSARLCVFTTPIKMSSKVAIGISKVTPNTKNSFKQKLK